MANLLEVVRLGSVPALVPLTEECVLFTRA